MKDKATATLDKILRQKAEEFLKNKSISTDTHCTDIEISKLVHELDVHQIELEMQNEELRTAKIKAEFEAEKYTNLYDFAPSGYLTLSKKGEIVELNFRGAILLGKERSLLQNKRFGLFVTDDTRPTFNLFLEEIFESKTSQTCEVKLANNSIIPTFVYLTGIINEDNKQCAITMHDVSLRKKAEEETKISEEKYRTLFETNRDSITIFRLDKEGKPGNFIEVNPATKSIFGYTKKDLLALSVGDIDIVSDKKREFLKTILLSEGKVNFETVIKNKKGDYRHVEIETVVINYLNEPAVMNITRDITERRQNEENTRKAQENLTTIFEAIPDLLFEVDLEGKIYYYQGHRKELLYIPESEFTGKLISEVLPSAVATTILEAIEEANKKGWSNGKEYALDLPQGKCWFELSVSPIKETGKMNPHFIALARDITVRKEAEEKLKIEKERIKTILELVGNPIFLKDNEHRITFANSAFCTLFGLDEKSIIGKTLAENVPENEKEHFLRIDRKVLDTGITDIREETLTVNGKIHTIITSKTRFIDAAGNKSLVGAIYDITERKKAQEELQKTQEKLQGIFNVANSGIVLIDNSGNFLLFNDWCCKLLGYTRSEFQELNAAIISHPDDLAESNVLNKKIIEGKIDTYQIEKRYLRKDKSYVWCEISASAIKDQDNNVVNIIGIVNDITDRIKNKEALEKSQEKLRGVFDLANSGIILTDLKGKYLLFNNWFTKALGYTREELNKFRRGDLTHPDDLENSNQHFKKLVDGKIEQYQIEKRFVRKDKSYFWTEISVSAIKDKNNKVVNTIGIINDITEKRNAKIALQESEARLIETQELAKVGSWETDFSFKNAIWSKETARIYGIDENATQFTLEHFLSLVHPEDRLQVQTEFVHSIKKTSLNKLEHRIVNYAGIEKFVEQRWVIIRDTQDKPLRAVGSCHDITERKQAEELVLQSKTRFRSIIDSSPVAMALNDEQLNITYINPAFIAMFGYTLAEIPTINDWFPKAYPEPKYRKKITEAWVTEIKKVTQTGEDFIPMEVTIRCKNGSDKTVMVSANQLLHSYNIEYLINFYDITERKLAEQALQNEKRRLAVILIGTGAGTWEWNIQTGATIFNEQWANIIGYTLDEIAPVTIETWRRFTHPDDLKQSEAILEKHFQGNQDYYESEVRMKHKNGDWIWVNARGRINEWDIDGKSLYMSGTHVDITERKLAEQKLIASEKLLNETQFLANIGSYSLDFSRGKWHSSAALDSIFGIDSHYDKTIEGWIRIIHPEWQTIMSEYLYNEIITKKTVFNNEYKIIKIDTQEDRWVHGNGEIIYNQQGQLQQLIGSIQDITERKLKDEELKKASEKFQNLVNSTEGIVWEADALTFNFTYINQQAERLFGFAVEDWYTDGFWKNHLHPEDKEKTIAFCASQTKQMISHDFTYRFICKKGNIIWLRDIVNVIVEDGKPCWLRGVMFDITNLKENEISLQESEEQYRNLVENSPDGVVIYVEDKIAFINSEGVRMLGAKSKEEIIGKPVLQFVHPTSSKEVTKKMKEIVADNYISSTVEVRFLDLNGVPFDVEIKGIPTIYKHQNAVQIIVHDITLRKQTSLELNKINRVYALISQINNLIIRTRSQEELFQEICNIAVDFGKFRMSWIGHANLAITES